MEAIKKIIKTKKNKITLDIPNEFKNKDIEVIMIPSEENENINKKDFIKFLKSGPTLSNNEIDNIEKAGKNINQWKIEKF